MTDFTDEQVERYSRHIMLPEVGGIGQRKLLDARVLLIGAGGLGSPIIAGLVQDNLAFILEGAIPAAMLAILADQLLANIEGIFAYQTEST